MSELESARAVWSRFRWWVLVKVVDQSAENQFVERRVCLVGLRNIRASRI
jgi:hypothetical protein